MCSSTHLYGRRLVLEWAEDEDSVDALRKRTAEHFHGSILFNGNIKKCCNDNNANNINNNNNNNNDDDDDNNSNNDT